MRIKNFLACSIVGAFVYYLLGWIIYRTLLVDLFPPSTELTTLSLVYIFTAGLCYVMLISFIFIHWAKITTPGNGFSSGAIIGLFQGFHFNLFRIVYDDIPLELAVLDVVISIFISAMTGVVIGLVNGQMEK